MVTQQRLRYKQRLADKLLDLGNLTLVALAISQFVGVQSIQWQAVIFGSLAGITCYALSYYFDK